MSITQIDNTHFHFKDIDLSIVNALRRIIISEIPNVAINFDVTDVTHSDFIINKNTCALHNEFLAHRVSLIPVCLNEDEINDFDPENYVFKIKEKNTTAEIMSITSKHIQIFDKNDKKMVDKNRNRIFPANPKTKDYILITKLKPNLSNLNEGEEIDIVCKASKNIAMVHARWSPVSHCSFINSVDEIESQKALEAKLETAKDGKEKESITSQFKTLDMFRYFKKNKYDEPNEFDFTIESECALTPFYLLKTSFAVLIQRLTNFIINLDDSSKVKINQIVSIPNFYELEIKDETYTLLNVLQSMIYNINMRETANKSKNLEFIGYYNPHPLDNKMILKVKFTSDAIILKDFLKENCEAIIKILNGYNEFLKE